MSDDDDYEFRSEWVVEVLGNGLVIPASSSVRDSWCTPQWLTDLLPEVDIDPCSNERSTVKAKVSLCGGGEYDNGLCLDWTQCSVYCNPPYSNILPWAEKAREAQSWIFLVNHDHSTKWWKALRASGGSHLFLFDRRIRFEPPPGVSISSNSKPQSIVANYNGRKLIADRLDSLGSWWMQE